MWGIVKISVITVCFNSSETIGKTLLSVSLQTYGNIEHIVVDGGSKDDTLLVIAKEGAHVSKLISENDHGIYDAMNKGISIATGDVIGFINSDDFYASPTVLEIISLAFMNSNVEACYGDIFYVGKKNTRNILRYWKSSEFQPKSFEMGWSPPHPTFFVRRELYERFGGFDLSYKIAADVELMMRFLEVHRVRVKYIPEVLVKMRIGGTTNRSLGNIFKQNKEILRALKSHGLRSSIVWLMANKLASRGLQFIVRPVQA